MKKTKTLWKSGRIETTLTYAAACLALIITLVILGDEIGRHIKVFEGWIEGLGPWALAVFILLYAILSSAFFPESLLGIIAGATFGFTQGLVAVACGNLVAAILQYALSRRLLKPAIDRMLVSRPALAAIQTAVLQQELRLQLLIRLTPLNRALTSYVLGAAGVGFTRFVTACAAILPNLCLEVYFGYAGKHLAQAGQQEHTAFLHDIVLVAGLVVAITVMFLVSGMARRAIEKAAMPGSRTGFSRTEL